MSKFHFIILICLFSLATHNVIARQDISLKEVVKLDLSMKGAFMSGPNETKKFETVNEKGIWKTYQLKDSLTRMFVKEVPKSQLIELFNIINEKDTSVKMEPFNIQHQEMAVVFDSLLKTDFLKDSGIKPYQKTAFIVALQDKKRIELMLRKVLIPLFMDDRTSYKIVITMKSGKTQVISALSFANIYNLPWTIDDQPLYNPNISRAFASITGDERFEKQSKDILYRRLIRGIFRSEFRNLFTWVNLKKEFAVAVDKLGNTLEMDRCFKNEYGWSITLSSSLLPKHFSVGGNFRRPDTILPEMKLLESRLVKLREQNHYIFTRLLEIPDFRAQAIVTENSRDDDLEPRALAELKTKYKKIAPLRFEQVTFIEVYRVASVVTGTWVDKWVLLPDDTLIVIPHKRPGMVKQRTAFVYSDKGILLETLTDLNLPWF